MKTEENNVLRRTLHILIFFMKKILFPNISNVVLLRASQVSSNAKRRSNYAEYRQDSSMVHVGIGWQEMTPAPGIWHWRER